MPDAAEPTLPNRQRLVITSRAGISLRAVPQPGGAWRSLTSSLEAVVRLPGFEQGGPASGHPALFEVMGEPPAAAELKRRVELLPSQSNAPETLGREVYSAPFASATGSTSASATKSWGAIEIAADGWRVVQSPPVTQRVCAHLRK